MSYGSIYTYSLIVTYLQKSHSCRGRYKPLSKVDPLKNLNDYVTGWGLVQLVLDIPTPSHRIENLRKPLRLHVRHTRPLVTFYLGSLLLRPPTSSPSQTRRIWEQTLWQWLPLKRTWDESLNNELYRKKGDGLNSNSKRFSTNTSTQNLSKTRQFNEKVLEHFCWFR